MIQAEFITSSNNSMTFPSPLYLPLRVLAKSRRRARVVSAFRPPLSASARQFFQPQIHPGGGGKCTCLVCAVCWT